MNPTTPSQYKPQPDDSMTMEELEVVERLKSERLQMGNVRDLRVRFQVPEKEGKKLVKKLVRFGILVALDNKGAFRFPPSEKPAPAPSLTLAPAMA